MFFLDYTFSENLKEKNRQARTVREFIEGQLQEVQARLSSAEEALKKFKESGEATGIAVPLQNKLADLETERSRLLRTYTELHPDIVKLNDEVTSLKEQIRLLPDKELQYARLTRELEVNEKLYKTLQEKFEEARIAEVEKVPDVSLVNPAILPRAPVSPNKRLNGLLGIAVGLVLGLIMGFTVEHMDTSIGTIEDVEAVLKLPVLGVIPYINVEGEKTGIWQRLWSKKYRGEEKIGRLKAQLIFYHSLRSAEVEAYRILRTTIQQEILKGEKGKILLFTSASPEEGKSLTVSNLAIAFAQGGNKTLLIDADMRRSSIHKIFGMKNREPGLGDFLSGTSDLRQAIRNITDIMMGEVGLDEILKIPNIDNLHIITSGSTSPISAETLSLLQTTNLLQKLKGEFDIVLIDSPPVLAVADTLVLAAKVDGLILIYRVGKTSTKVVLRTKSQLQEVNAPIKGVILNNISREVELHYSYPYHYRYYRKYYGEKEKEKEKVKA